MSRYIPLGWIWIAWQDPTTLMLMYVAPQPKGVNVYVYKRWSHFNTKYPQRSHNTGTIYNGMEFGIEFGMRASRRRRRRGKWWGRKLKLVSVEYCWTWLQSYYDWLVGLLIIMPVGLGWEASQNWQMSFSTHSSFTFTLKVEGKEVDVGSLIVITLSSTLPIFRFLSFPVPGYQN